jgi:hypothetical protein
MLANSSMATGLQVLRWGHILILGGLLVATACSDQVASPLLSVDAGVDAGGGAFDAGPLPDVTTNDAASAFSATLTLSLDPTLDGDDGDVKAQSIVSAVMLDKTGASKTVASVAGGSAVFNLKSLNAGDYFLEINGDVADLVPTRIDDPNTAISQRVGQKLRASYIGPASNPAYRINTYSAGQKGAPVVRFSDGTTIPSEQPYVLFSFVSSQLEINLLGSAQSLTSLALHSCAGHSYVPADGWLLNTSNEDHHGDMYNADGGSENCSSCHYNDWRKPLTSGDTTPAHGWCFRCHFGPDGAGTGFVDPTH